MRRPVNSSLMRFPMFQMGYNNDFWCGSARDCFVRLQVRAEMLGLAEGDSQLYDLCAIAELAGAAVEAVDGGGCEFAFFPIQIYFEVTARAQATDRSGGPGRWQCRQHLQNPDCGALTLRIGPGTLDFRFLALQQHFADAGGDAEVTVHLHRGVQAEKVRAGGRSAE